jgi:hypothetical protein
MLIGVDFDNTIVCYDEVFYQAAVEKGLIPEDVSINKGSVRDYLRASGKEEAWTELQGVVYGVYIQHAPPFTGVTEFFKRCRKHNIRIYIISHKTRYPFLGKTYDLHDAAHKWLEQNGFYDSETTGLNREQVYFELTKKEKIDRIATVGCNYFIDDLPEFLKEPEFPEGVVRILFDPNNHYPVNNNFLRSISWKEIEKIIFGVCT